MLQDVYIFERLLELGRLEHGAPMWREQRFLEAHGHARCPHARLAYMAYILTLFRLV
jgi:hypothetical protein